MYALKIHIPLKKSEIMQYFQAVQKGKQRANQSQMKLFDVAGFAMLTLTTKKVDGKFLPVGEEDFAAAIKTPDGFVVILVDGDGYTKSHTKPLEKDEASKIFKKIRETGIEEYSGGDISIWTERNPTVQNEF